MRSPLPAVPRHTRTLRLVVVLFGLASLVGVRQSLLSPVRAASVGPALTVDAAAERHVISPDIYGITFWWGDKKAAESAFASAIHLPVNRSGGDGTPRYNWQVDSSNAGEDWYFMGGNGNANPTPGATYDAIVDTNHGVGAKSILTIPIIGYINAGSAWICSFPKSVYGEQQSYNPYIHPNGEDCGNGKRKSDGSNIADTNITAHDKANDPAIQKAWVQHLIQKHGTAANGGVSIYQLDNEPSGWLAVHRDVHPQGVGYTELRDRSISYAAAVKSVDPSAQTLGPGDIPYAYNDCNNCGNDGAAAHGGTPFGKWYLQQMAAYERQNGVRVLDYYAMHYPGCCGGDPFQIAQDRIHTFRGWINSEYPGTKLAFDEYNWDRSVEQQIGGALQVGEGLGMFGREQVDLASYWGMDDVTWPVAYGFRMYRNYDGQGGTFGDTSLSATSADASKLTVYAAQRSSDGALTVMVLNKGDSELTSNLALSGFRPGAKAQVYQYSGANLQAIQHQPDIQVNASGWSATYPAKSITLVVVPSTDPVPTVGTTTTTTTTTPGTQMTPTSTLPSCTPTATRTVNTPSATRTATATATAGMPTMTGTASTATVTATAEIGSESRQYLPIVLNGSGQASCR